MNLNHLPGNKGLPIVGEFLKITKRGINYFKEEKDKHGSVYKFKMPTGMVVGVFGETSAIDILKNYGDKINIGNATKDLIGKIYPNSIMLMDGPKHKKHRSILQQAFTGKALDEYIKIMPSIIEQTMKEMRGQDIVKVYPKFKILTLRMAGKIFFGIEDKDFIEQINKAITPMTRAQVSVPINFPGTVYNKALKGRKFLSAEFLKLVPERRANPGPDLFSKLCFALNEEGEQFSDQEIVDHLLFLVQASHDTTAWTLSHLVYCLAKYPDWQEKMRAEVIDLSFEELNLRKLLGLPISSMVLKESMRLAPSVPLTIREASIDLEVEGKKIPKGTKVWVSLEMPMKDPKHWTNPEKFDPERFGDERKEHKSCPYAFMPFGAGVHLCLGNIFAEMSVKMMAMALLKEFKVSLSDNYEMPMNEFPMMMPKDDLPIRFEELILQV